MKILKVLLIIIFGLILFVSIGFAFSKINGMDQAQPVFKESSLIIFEDPLEFVSGETSGLTEAMNGGKNKENDNISTWVLLLISILVTIILLKFSYPYLKNNYYLKLIFKGNK